MRRSGLLIALLAAVAGTAAPARAQAGPLSCDPTAAEAAVEADDGFVSAIRDTGAVGKDEDVFDVYSLDELYCHDLTGDKLQEMVVYITCCTAASPTPLAIFRQKRGEWKLAYSSTRLLINVVRRVKREVRLVSPVYKRTDMLCCPSSHKKYVVKYRKGKFRRTTRP